MKWSMKVGKVAGIDLRLHFTFLILIAWLIGAHYLAGHSPVAAMAGVSFTLLLFAIIILHELGHALAARQYGIKTKHITLLPIGGVAHLERIPEDPKQELIVAIAGPAVNIALAAILFALTVAFEGVASLANVSLTSGDFLARLFWLNLWIAGFNLLPAFPMDGGRVLRALLAMRLSRERATDLAAGIGQAIAFVLGFVGLFTHPFLLFIAFFVWIGAEGEAAQVRMKAELADVKIRDVMLPNFQTVDASDTLIIAAHRMVPGSQHILPVLEEGKFIGFIGTEALSRAIADAGPNARVKTHVERAVVSATPDEHLSSVLPRWEDSGTAVVAVFFGDILVGLVTSESIGKYLLIHDALTSPSAKSAGANLSLRRSP